jgi:putative phosphoesterase
VALYQIVCGGNTVHLAVLSDIHGNLPALEAVLQDLQRWDIVGIIVAGDFIGGPQPIETLRRLQSLDAWMIRGNSDDNLLRYGNGLAPQAWHNSRQFALLRWAHRQVDKGAFEVLQSLPQQRVVRLPDTVAIRVVHGSPRNPAESIFPDREPTTLDLALAQVDEPVFVCGHTHIPWKVERHGRLALNPGAVCGPLNGETGAQYALLTWQDSHWHVDHRIVEYDLQQIREAFRESGLMYEGGALARSFLRSIETGENVADWFLTYAYDLAAEAGQKEQAVVPDEIWERAATTFDWEATTRPGTQQSLARCLQDSFSKNVPTEPIFSMERQIMTDKKGIEKDAQERRVSDRQR